MSFLSPEDELWLEISSIGESEGLEVYDVERFAATGLRIFVEKKGRFLSQAASVCNEKHVADGESDASVDSGGNEVQPRITSGDCSRLCRRLMVFFTVEGERFGLSAEPQLEVSSPGVNRHLRLPFHFNTAVGERVRIVFADGYASVDSGEPRTVSVLGELRGVADGQLQVVSEEKAGNIVVCPMRAIKKARVDFKFD